MGPENYRPLCVARRQQGDELVLRVSGELDLASAADFRHELLTAIEEGGDAVTLDLADVSFIDSTGLSVIVLGLRQLAGRGGTLRLSNPRPSAQRLFGIVGLDKVIDIRHDTIAPT